MPRARGSKNRRTIERETAKEIAAARAELVKNAPPLDFSMPIDSLDMMEHAIRHFYFRAKIGQIAGAAALLSSRPSTRNTPGPFLFESRRAVVKEHHRLAAFQRT
jgi:hypothetical protein